jgi:hypothetical protein
LPHPSKSDVACHLVVGQYKQVGNIHQLILQVGYIHFTLRLNFSETTDNSVKRGKMSLKATNNRLLQ